MLEILWYLLFPLTAYPACQLPPVSEPFDLTLAVYTPEDSAQVVHLLAQDPGPNDVLFYARSFLGKPYVAYTLEVCDPERLVVNLQQFDCTTLVETVYALCATKRSGQYSFEAFCSNLEQLRYFSGKMNGYLSRLHYFTWWMHDNLDKNLFVEVSDSIHFTAPIRVENHYMSSHPEKYKYLRAHPEWVDSVKALEECFNGPDGFYLPAALTKLSRKELPCIHDGDLIALVTKKDGLDYSHLGIAVWGQDNKLHLLNASSLHHKVVSEPKTLYTYLTEHPSSVGIRLLRLR